MLSSESLAAVAPEVLSADGSTEPAPVPSPQLALLGDDGRVLFVELGPEACTAVLEVEAPWPGSATSSSSSSSAAGGGASRGTVTPIVQVRALAKGGACTRLTR